MGSESAPPRKRQRLATPEPLPKSTSFDDSLGGLYDFLPPPDPAKDAAAKAAADKSQFARPKLPPENRTRVIFLDVDGVLLPTGSIETIVVDGVSLPVRDTVRESDFPVAALGNLRTIVQQTGATLVLSSEWRRTDRLRASIQAVLKAQDICSHFRDATPIFHPKPELQAHHPILAWVERRAREIGKWLKDNPDVSAWVALDDLDFEHADRVRVAGTPFIKYRSVCTDDKKCLTEDDAKEAVRILLDPPPEPRPKRVREVAEEDTTPAFLCSTEDSMPDRGRLG